MWHRVSTFLLSHQSNSEENKDVTGRDGSYYQNLAAATLLPSSSPLSEVSTSISNTKIQKLQQMQFYSMWLEICQITIESSNKNASRLRPVFVILVLSFSPSHHLHWPQPILIVQCSSQTCFQMMAGEPIVLLLTLALFNLGQATTCQGDNCPTGDFYLELNQQSMAFQLRLNYN